VDLEQHQVVDLLEEATAKAFCDWLLANPGVEVMSQDRRGAFADGSREEAPESTQLPDAIEAFRKRIHRHLPPATSPAPAVVPSDPATPPRRGGREEAVRATPLAIGR
jgi:hypothetical protein